MPERPIGIYTHTEKTAGVTNLWSAEQAIGKDSIYIWSSKAQRLAKDSDNVIPLTSPVLEFLRAAASTPVVGAVVANLWSGSDRTYRRILERKYPTLEIPEDARLLTGHFVADRFDSLLDEREPVRGVMIREPLDRMISHYNYWWRDRGGDDWRVRIPFRRGLNFQEYFREFAMLPEHHNFQTQALGGLDLSHFDVVGVTEHTDQFIEAFLGKLSEKGLTLPGQARDFPKKRLNVNRMRQRIRREDLDEEFGEAFKTFHAQDYALYEQAKEIQERQISGDKSGNSCKRQEHRGPLSIYAF
jgi:hypothetical protein